jgi:hypothetical protein
MFGETFRYGTTGTALALSCGVVAAGGLILLTSERIARSESAPEPVRVPAQPEAPEPVRDARTDEVRVQVPASAAELLAALPGQATAPEQALVAESAVREELLAATAESALEEVLVPSAQPDDTAARDTEEHPIFYVGPLYGASYIPMPVLDRHRARVKS